VEKEFEKIIKIVRYDRGREYYGKYVATKQNKGPFALYLQDYGIVP